MRKFFIVFLVTLLASALLWAVIVWNQAGKPTQMSQWIYDAYRKKQNIAKAIEGKKIVIVAGSNALFGVDSKMISEVFTLPVVNDSVNAGIELPCILFMAKKVIGKGDTVLMPLEYPMYSYTGKPGVQMIDFLLAREPLCFWKLTTKEQFYLLWHVSMQRVWEGYIGYQNKPVTTGLYGAHHINAYGDQNETEVRYRSEAMHQEVLEYAKKPEKYGKAYNPEALGWEYLERFVIWCKKREVKVIFMPSTLLYDKSYTADPKEKWFYTHIGEEVRKRGWTFVGDPYAYMYDASCYLNTNFHLIDSGRKKRTEKIIEDLLTETVFK